MKRRMEAVSSSQSSPSIKTLSSMMRNKTIASGNQSVSFKMPLKVGYKDHKMTVVDIHEKGAEVERKPYLIYEGGINYTPKPLSDPSFPTGPTKGSTAMTGKAVKLSLMDKMGDTQSLNSVQSFFSIRRSRAVSMAGSIRSSMLWSLGSDLSFTAMLRTTEDELLEREEELKNETPSMFRLREDPPPRKPKIESKFTINLEETETEFHLALPTGASCLDSEEGRVISQVNCDYERVLQTNKSASHTATQTTRVFANNRKLYMPMNSRANAEAYATSWDIYDCILEEHTRTSLKSVFSREEGQVDCIQEIPEEDIIGDLDFSGREFNERLLKALMIMERLIQQNTYSEQQLLFQGLLVEDPLSINAKCNYTLKHLWTFHNELTTKRNVTSISWCKQNHNIVAVGYGKFKYNDKCDGLVCLWNIKNPHNPERYFKFEDPVTCVSFSHYRPQILAVTFYNGLVLLLDITTRSLTIKATNNQYPSYGPVWQALWYPHVPLSSGQHLITCGKDGRVFKYKKTKFFVSKSIQLMARPHKNIQGVAQPRKCHARKTLTNRNPPAEVMALHPTDPMIYLVGTSEGCVYYCSINHRHEHIDVFVAHNGPVYSIQFNPFCSKIFLTCGADWCIRIWAEGIFDPLITLESGMVSVQAAIWNPLHSTVIVSITGLFVEIWDIRRKITTPKSSMASPTKSYNTTIKFSENKYNLCVGDADGHVHVLALTEMPFSPFFQDEVLAQAIQNALISHPEMLIKLHRLGHPFVYDHPSVKNQMHKKLDFLHKVI